jgi:hypothetical protein
MKSCFWASALLSVSLYAADPEPAPPAAPITHDDYSQFVEQLGTPDNLTDCISTMDGLIDEGERLAAPGPGGVSGDTKLGLHMGFYVMAGDQAVVYYLAISRHGLDFGLSEATELAALFGDRAGLPHPIIVTEGEKPIYYAQWYIKHSDWKSLKKKMLKARALNRSEKDPQKAWVIAVARELNARNAAPQDDR